MLSILQKSDTMRLLIVLALIGAACAARRSNRIVGGAPTTIETYPYMVNVQYHYWGLIWMQWCGGSLLTSRSVLSAAHCFYDTRENEWRLRLGTNSSSSGGTVYQVERIILHPEYSYVNDKNDLVVLILQTAATFSESVGIARIPGTNFRLPDGTNVVAIGWGALWSGGPSPEQLHHVTINIINHEVCTARYLEYKNLVEADGYNFPWEVDAGMVCAGILDVGGKDACQGDSGGPLSYVHPDGDIVYGITSWGAGCAHSHYPGVNTLVAFFSDWIFENASV